jgi:hypothetical protein
MRAAVLLLWLTLVVPVAQAADWLAWRKVGDATLTWGRSPSIPPSCVRRTGVTVGTRIRR